RPQYCAVRKMPDPVAKNSGERQFPTLFDNAPEGFGGDCCSVLPRSCCGAEQDLAVGLLKRGPVAALNPFEEEGDAATRGFVTRQSFGVAAKAVVFRITYQTRAHGVEIDVGGHRAHDS